MILLEKNMKPTIHHTPGRIRLRHNRLRTDAARFRAFCRETRAIDGIERCDHNPYAGSVTIVYDDKIF